MRRAALALILLACAAGAAAQSGVPRGGDDVLLARVHRKTAKGIDAIGRIGVVLSGDRSDRALEIPAADGAPAGTLRLSAERKGSGARATWELTGGMAGSGTLVVNAGALNRVSLWQSGEVEVFASLEAGRASSFDVSRLALHFGAVPWGMQPAQPTGYVFPTGPGAAAVPSAPRGPRGPAIDLSCPSGAAFQLALDTGRGKCALRMDAGSEIAGASCDDGEGSSAEADCRVGGGACVATSGTGTCRKR